MRSIIAVILAALLPLLGLPGAGQAQSAVQIEGTIAAVDCQAATVVLNSPGGSNTIEAADATAVLVNSTSVPFCSLAGYIGAPATAWLAPDGNQFWATQIDVTGPIATVPAPTEVVSPVPIAGAVLGTIVAAGLVYLLVHGPDGGYYRYPYYGAYYHYYYRSQYRPYTGFYPASAPVITAAPAITGVVLGTVAVNNFQYILTRAPSGHLYRYPYYGPYRAYYYRPTYRPYAGAYQDVPVRQGDPRWDAPARIVSPAGEAPAAHTVPRPAIVQPVVQPPAQRSAPRPVMQRPAAQPAAQRPASQPVIQRPAPQPTVQQSLPRTGTPQPMVQRPAAAPAVQHPAPQPAVQRSAAQSVIQRPAAQPPVQRPAPQPTAQRAAPRPAWQQPLMSPAVQPRPAPQPALQRLVPHPAAVPQNDGRGNSRGSNGATPQCGAHTQDQSCPGNGANSHR